MLLPLGLGGSSGIPLDCGSSLGKMSKYKRLVKYQMLYLVGLFSLAHYSSERISKYYQMESNKDILYSVQLKLQFLDMQGIILTSNKILFIHNYIVSVEKQGESRLYIIYIYTLCILVGDFVFATINLLNIKLFCLTIRECTNHDTWHIHIKNSSSNHLAREILT